MVEKQDLRIKWYHATGELPYGVQGVFKDVLALVADEKKKDLIYGADYGSGGACLVNAAGNMLASHENVSEGGGYGIPMKRFGEVVSLFDQINQLLWKEGVNTDDRFVSPLAAEILLQWFGPEKQPPNPEDIAEAKAKAFADNVPYTEPTDEELRESFLAALNNPDRISTPFDQVVVDEPSSENIS